MSTVAAYDVVIVGGGIIGSAIAHFLTRDEAFAGTVAVIETDPTYEFATTPRSVASIRQQFTTEVNVRISQFGIQFFRAARETFGPDADIGLKEPGYLLLADDASAAAHRERVTWQRGVDADVAWLAPSELGERFPWLADDETAGGSLGLSGEGWIDPHSLLHLFIASGKAGGVDYITGEVVGMNTTAGNVDAVTLADGRRLASGTVVNAAGKYADGVARMAGADIPVEPRKRCVFAFDCRDKDAMAETPLVITANGVAFRREGPGFITCVSPPEDRDPVTLDFEVEHWQFEDIIWPELARLVPAFEAIKVTSFWACHYAFNTFDQNAILGPHPAASNLLLANGFSGHGLQQAPAVGRGIAEWITYGEYRSLDLTDLGYDRITQNRPHVEGNVY